eukprot:SAG31_NODE_26100_length_448_cov_1.028653_1_plen_78_part_01
MTGDTTVNVSGVYNVTGHFTQSYVAFLPTTTDELLGYPTDKSLAEQFLPEKAVATDIDPGKKWSGDSGSWSQCNFVPG